MKPASVMIALGFGLAPAHPAFASAVVPDTVAWGGTAECRIAPLQPVATGPLRWNGQCVDGYAQGKGVLEWRAADGARKLETTLAKGVAQGEARLQLPDGGLYIGTVTHGVPDGKGYFKDADGMQYEGEVRMGRRDGLADGLFPKGDRYKGQWKDGKPHGSGTMNFMLGGAFEGRWRAGAPDGRGTMSFAGSGRRAEVHFIGGRRVVAEPRIIPEAGEKTSFALLAPEPQKDSLRPKKDATSRIPMNVGYEGLSPSQKQIVRQAYPALDDGDEPPYPLYGPQELFRSLNILAGEYWLNGEVTLWVLVAADGSVASAFATGIDDAGAARKAAIAAGLLKYKPARCGGRPCKMMVPFTVLLTSTMR